jgi:signal transduction histidine kinase
MAKSPQHQLRWRQHALPFEAVSRAVAICVAIVGLLALLGWAFHIDSLKSVVPGYATMKANTALCLLLSGTSLFLSSRALQGRTARLVAKGTGTLAALVSFLTLNEYWFGRNLGIDQRIFHDPLSSGRMAPATALNVLMVAAALLLMDAETRRGRRPSQFFALLTGFLSFVAILGYIFGVQSLYRISPYASMALHTSICLLLLGLGILFARPRQGIMVVLSEDSLGGAMARRFLPVVIAVPVLVGWIIMMGQRKGLFRTEFGLALVVTMNVAIFGVVTWWLAWELHDADTDRRRAHETTSALNEQLELLVKERTHELEQANAELKRSNLDLQQFSYIASHDLQEPLRMVASYTQLLSSRYKERLDEDADTFIAFAVDGCNRMKNLIQDLLAYSSSGLHEKALCVISGDDVFQEALTNLRAMIEESGAMVTHDALPQVTTDDGQLVQVFQNLVGNAIKYRSAAVPRVHVSARNNEGKEWIFSVRDNGLGIDPQYFERIFIIFQRLHGQQEFEGTGIGLAICKRVLERMGGRIWVESEVEKGSTFYFALPERGGI